MIAKMFLFEWRYFTRQPSFYVSILILLLILFGFAIFTSGFNKMEDLFGSNVFINGPFFIGQFMEIFTFFSLFLVVIFIANTALRDKLTDMNEILYCKPIDPLVYQTGRVFYRRAVAII